MAKNSKSVKQEKILKEEIIAENNEEIKEVKEIKEDNTISEVELLKAQLEEMKKAMAEMMNKASVPSQSVIIKEEEGEIYIGCRMLQGIGLSSSDNSIQIRLRFNEEQPITIREMKLLLRKASIRKIFEDGLCYFKEKENYDLFGIKKYKDLSDEMIVSLLKLNNVNEITRELNDITENKRNSAVLNCIIYRMCDMIRKGTLKSLDYYIRTGLEDYFKVEFNRGINTLNSLDALKQ